MTSYFKRVARALIIGQDKAKEISQLKIVFDIELTDSSDANKAKITIYNPNDETINIINEKGSKIAFSAGYKGLSTDADELVEVLITGDIMRVIPSSKGIDKSYTIECGDSEIAIKDSVVNKSFGAKTAIKDVINDVASTLGLAVSDNSDKDLGTLENGLALSGKSKNALDMLTLKVGIKWTIQNGELFFYKLNGSNGQDVVILNSSSGLIEAKKAKKDEDGYNIKSLLNPKFRPGRIIRVQSKNVSGDFIISKVQFKGDTHGGDFVAEIEAK